MLTPSETKVYDLLLEGRSVKYIADKLCVSPNTIGSHMKSIYKAVGVHSHAELLARELELMVMKAEAKEATLKRATEFCIWLSKENDKLRRIIGDVK